MTSPLDHLLHWGMRAWYVAFPPQIRREITPAAIQIHEGRPATAATARGDDHRPQQRSHR